LPGNSTKDEARLKYLLGTAALSDEEKSRLEDEYFADDQSFEELEIAEEELIDAYVGDRLSPSDRQAFNKRLISSPRLREQVEFARLFAQKIDQAQETTTRTQPAVPDKPTWWAALFGGKPGLKVGFALAALLLVAGTALFLGIRWRAESNRIAAEQAAAQRREAERRAEEQRKQLEREQQQQQAAKDKQAEEERLAQQQPEGQQLVHALATIALLPGVSRSFGAGPELLIGADTKSAQVTLRQVPSDYSKFMVTIKTPEGKQVLQKSVPRKNANLTFSVSPEILAAGDYIVHIDGITSSGVEDVNDYSLRVRRKK
jgi:hypothetical protein